MKATTLRAQLSSYKNKFGHRGIVIQIVHNRQTARIKTGYFVEPTQFKAGRVVKHPNASLINMRLGELLTELEQQLDKITIVSHSLSALELKKQLEKGIIRDTAPVETDFFAFGRRVLDTLESEYKQKLERTGKASRKTIANYTTVLNSLKDYTQQKTIEFEQIDTEFVTNYAKHLQSQGIKNGVSNYIKDFKALYNRAIKAAITPNTQPFKYTPVNKYRKQAEPRVLSSEQIAQLVSYTPTNKIQRTARAAFLFSFYTIGANPIDIFFAGTPTGAQFEADRFTYNRSKTDEKISIQLHPFAKSLFTELAGIREKYNDLNGFKKAMNKALKKIAVEITLPAFSLTYARHSWATIAYNELDISETIIDYALGHRSSRTLAAAHYIKKERAQIDKANAAVIAHIQQLAETNQQIIGHSVE